jgi:hypothetical protein
MDAMKDRGKQMHFNADVERLKHHVQVVCGKVAASNASRAALRTEIHGLIYEFGLPSFFCTINPADMHHPLLLHFAGEKIDLTRCLPPHLQDAHERRRLVARHPEAGARFFREVVLAFLHDLLRFPLGKNTTNHDVSLLGVGQAFYGTVETQGRGSLHLHILVNIYKMKKRLLKRLIKVNKIIQ